MRVMVVSERSSLESDLCALLIVSGHDVNQSSFKNINDKAILFKPEMIVVDLTDADYIGGAVYTQLAIWAAPVIAILSSSANESTKIKLLDAGAQDLLVLPFGQGELLARMRAVQRRVGIANYDALVFTCGDRRIDFANHVIIYENEEIPLTPHEYLLLRHLVLNKNRLVTHKQLVAVIREPGDAPLIQSEISENTSHLLRVHINNLRSKLEKDPRRPQYIMTETRLGYRFRA